MHNYVKGYIYASITAILWGLLAIALKVSLSDLTAADITWFRFFNAFTYLSAYYLIRKPQYLRILRKPPLLLIVAAVSLAVNYYGFVKGVELTSPSIAQIFIQLGPVLLAVSGILFFKEKVNWKQIVGFILVLTGLTVFYNEQFHTVFNGAGKWQGGVNWVILAAICWTLYSILIKVLVTKYPPMQLNLVIFGLPAIIFLPFVNFGHFLDLSLVNWLILLFLGLNTLFAYGLLSMALQCIEANKVSIIIVFNPILTFIIMAILAITDAKWIEHEYYTFITIIGAAVVLSGGLLAVIKKRVRNNRNLFKE